MEWLAEGDLLVHTVDVEESPVSTDAQLEELPPYSGSHSPEHVEPPESVLLVVDALLKRGGLSESLSIPVYKAKEFIERYFATYPKVKEYVSAVIEFAREHGYAVTMLGRRRDLKEMTASNRVLRAAAERMARNTPLQGSAADIVKIAMLAVEKRLAGMRSRLILQIHDELIVDAAEEEREEVARILKEEMESAVSLKVPLIVEVNAAKDWGELK